MNLYPHLSRVVHEAASVSIYEGFWYLLLALGAWLLFYVLLSSAFQHRRLSRRDPTSRQIAREIFFSIRSIVIFGLVWATTVLAASSMSYHIFRGRDAGWIWFFVSIALMIVVHDTYFYWTHRLMHHRLLYRFFHHSHHLSTSPTPWAAYAFSPAEAVVQAGIAPLIVLLTPVQPGALGVFMIWQITFNVLGHCGHEIYPKWFLRSSASHLLNSVTHHALHHEKFNGNFSLYFNVWDRLLGTNHRDYTIRLEKVIGGPR